VGYISAAQKKTGSAGRSRKNPEPDESNLHLRILFLEHLL
jgi:hypothetical protein